MPRCWLVPAVVSSLFTAWAATGPLPTTPSWIHCTGSLADDDLLGQHGPARV